MTWTYLNGILGNDAIGEGKVGMDVVLHRNATEENGNNSRELRKDELRWRDREKEKRGAGYVESFSRDVRGEGEEDQDHELQLGVQIQRRVLEYQRYHKGLG